MRHRLPFILLGLATLTAVVPAASAQLQSVHIEPGPNVHWQSVPDQLPGTYRGLVEVTTATSNGLPCVCQSTNVEVHAGLEPDLAPVAVAPQSYHVNWFEHHSPGMEHRQVVGISFRLAEAPANGAVLHVATQGTAPTEGVLVHVVEGQASYVIPLPEDHTAPEPVAENDSSELTTQTRGDPVDQASVPAPSALALLAAVAGAAVALVRRRP